MGGRQHPIRPRISYQSPEYGGPNHHLGSVSAPARNPDGNWPSRLIFSVRRRTLGWGRKSSSLTSLLRFTPTPMLTPSSPPAHPTPALVARAQGGLTLGPERGELDAEK
jgi:hypothetical protein